MNYRLTELKVLLFLLLLSAVSCQRPMYDEEDDEDGVSQTNLPLKISARSSGGTKWMGSRDGFQYGGIQQRSYSGDGFSI